MKAHYSVLVKFDLYYNDIEKENLKSSSEMANDLSQMVCDECVNAGGIGTYQYIDSSVEVNDV